MSTTICRHIRINGARCGCLALKNSALCYQHAELARRQRALGRKPEDDTQTILHPMISDDMQRNPYVIEYFKGTGPHLLDLPPLEDRESIQLAISMVISAMARNQIESRRGTSILYGLQVASRNAFNLKLEPSKAVIVRDTVFTEDGQQLAPNEETEFEIMSRECLAELDRQDAEDASEDDD